MLFAFFNLTPMELIVLLTCCFLPLVGGGVAGLVIMLNQKKRRALERDKESAESED